MPLSSPAIVTVGSLPITEADVTGLVAGLAAKTAKATLTTKGDVYAASAASTPARVGVGADGTVLTADAASSAGVKWAPNGGSNPWKTYTVSYTDFVLGSGDATAPIVTIPDGDILVAAGLVVTQDFDDTGTGPFNMYDVTQNDLWTDAGIGPGVATPTNNRIGIASLDTPIAWGGKNFGPVMAVGPYPLVVYASVWNGDGAQGSLTALVCSYTPPS